MLTLVQRCRNPNTPQIIAQFGLKMVTNRYNVWMSRIDYTGITCLIAGSFFPPVFYGLHCSYFLKRFYVIGITCAEGYTGTPSTQVCVADGGAYRYSGCTQMQCSRPMDLTGYDTSDMSEVLDGGYDTQGGKGGFSSLGRTMVVKPGPMCHLSLAQEGERPLPRVPPDH